MQKSVLTKAAKLALVGISLVASVVAPSGLAAQDVTGRCASPDSIAIRGNTRTPDARIRGEMGLTPGTPLNFPSIQRSMKALYALNLFDDVQLLCDVESVPEKVLTVIQVRERAILGDIKVVGPKNVSERSVRDKIDLLIGRPIDPLLLAKARARIDSTYEAAGYYLAQVRIDSVQMDDERIGITYTVDEGRRLAIAGIDIVGNTFVKEKQVVSSMKTKPEGFWWFRKGEFDEDKFVGDLGERIPALFARLGHVDMRISQDTLIVDRERGKGLLQIGVEEGPRYRIGTFEVAGNRRFPTEDLKKFYPFEGNDPTLTQRVKGLITRQS